jgi:uncharacterized damage-inducible protein DinB
MDEKARFTELWTNECVTTQRVIDRIPENSDYRPDPRSRTAREIAWQIVGEERMLIDALENGKAEWAPGPLPASMKEVAAAYQTQSEQIIKRLKALSDDRWNGSLDFFGGQRPSASMAWNFLLDIIHHRGQISTYLRPMGAKVPQIYGPSGDEP